MLNLFWRPDMQVTCQGGGKHTLSYQFELSSYTKDPTEDLLYNVAAPGVPPFLVMEAGQGILLVKQDFT